MGSRMRSFHVGIDYGTSASKIVIRDTGKSPGEVCAWPVVRNGSVRIPSDVTFDTHNLYFGREPQAGERSVTSFKMRFGEAAAEGREHESLGGLPRPASDVLTLNLWWLLAQAKQACEAKLLKEEELELGFTFGAPVSFLDNPKVFQPLHKAVGEAAILVYALDTRPSGDTISWQDADDLLTRVRTQHPDAEHYVTESMLQPEGKAALLWAVRSPNVPLGSPFVEVDVGAGTTHASIFRINGDLGNKVKDRFSIYKAVAHASGMDGICAALVGEEGLEAIRTVRGHENEFLDEYAHQRRATGAILRIVGARDDAWKGIDEKNNAERLHWVECHMALCGGGSRVKAVVDALKQHPGTGTFKVVVPSPPRDFERSASEMLHFLLVAYGLSDPGLEFIKLVNPSEIEPMSDRRGREVRCYCGGKSWCPSCHGKGVRDSW